MTPTATQPAPIFLPETLHQIAPKDLVPNPLNPRGEIKPDAEMTASLKERGILQALSAFEREGKLVLIAGHRRRINAIAAKLATVPVVVQTEPPTGEQLADMLTENDGELRKGLTALQEATAYQALVDAGWTQTAIAGKVSKAQSHITKRLSLLKLPDDVVDKVEAGRITHDAAYELSKIRDPKVIKELTKYGTPGSYQIDIAIKKQQFSDAADKELKRLEAAGTRVVKLTQLGNGTAALLPVDLSGKQLGVPVHVIDLVAKAHAKQPCAALAVFPKLEPGEQTLPVCDNPAAHDGATIVKFGGDSWRRMTKTNLVEQSRENSRTKPADSKAEKAKEARELEKLQARFEERAARATDRRAFLEKQIKAPGKPAQLPLLNAGVFAGWEQDVYPDPGLVTQLLAIPGAETELEALAKTSAKDAARVALALAASMLETMLWSPPKATWAELDQYAKKQERWWGATATNKNGSWALASYVDWLKTSGFELSPIELDAVKK